MKRDLKSLIDGALGGAIATVAMSAVMLTGQQVGLMRRYPPEDVTDAALDATGVISETTPETRLELAVLAHLGFGVGAGALFSWLCRRGRWPIPTVAQGVIFGSLVWLVSYCGWVPALGILPPASKDQPGRAGTMIVAHWVFGALLGLVVAKTTPQEDQ